MLVQELLERSVDRYPEKRALVCGGRSLTYEEVEDGSNRVARALASSGLDRGDRVAICIENSVEAVLSIFATLKAGGVFIPMSPAMKADRLVYTLNHSRARALVSSVRSLEALAASGGAVPFLKTVVALGGSPPWAGLKGPEIVAFEGLLDGRSGDASRPASRNIDLDLAALIYTSGSTGNPKGVMMTHLNMVSAATAINAYLENRAGDVILDLLPLSFDYGLYQILLAFMVGATVVLDAPTVYSGMILELLTRERVTGFPLVPSISGLLLTTDLARCDLSSLRYMTNTGAAFPTSHIRKLRKSLPHVKIFSMYGLTECKRVSYLPPDQIDLRPHSVGKAMPNVEVSIVDEAGEPVGPGTVGELVVRGPNVMKGYWEDPEETAKFLRPGEAPGDVVLYTGDLFSMDEEGYLYFAGRKDDVIKIRAEKVSPVAVESVLYDLEGVEEAVAFPVPHEILGQALKVVIKPRSGAQLTAQEVIAHCARRLEPSSVPKFVEFRHAVPRTTTGKINRGELARTFQER